MEEAEPRTLRIDDQVLALRAASVDPRTAAVFLVVLTNLGGRTGTEVIASMWSNARRAAPCRIAAMAVRDAGKRPRK